MSSHRSEECLLLPTSSGQSFLYFQMPSAFYSLIPLLPRPCKADMAEVPVSPVFLDEQTEAQRRGWACDHPASHGGTLPLCVSGRVGRGAHFCDEIPQPVVESQPGESTAVCWPDPTRDPCDQSTPPTSGELRLQMLPSPAQ